MSGRPSVTVAGAGALGLSAALALADAGCAVTVCDPGGESASAVAAGMIAPACEAVLDPQARPQLDLLMAARDLWPGFAERAGVALDRAGAMAVGEAAWLDAIAGDLAGLGLRPMELPGPTAQALAPGLAPVERGLLVREDWRIDPRAALAALRRAAEGAGVAFRAEAVCAREAADVLVAATGASHSLAEMAPELSRLSPIKGHIVRFAAPAAGVTVRARGAYAAPGEGGLAVGATMEPGRGDSEIDPDAAAPLVAAGRRLFPALAGVPFAIAAGVRAATPDGLPLVGPSREPGVVIAAGARRNGWLLAPLVARLVAACVTEGDLGPYGRLFDPGRFEA